MIGAGFEHRLRLEMAARAARDRHGMEDDQLISIPQLAQRCETG
jgi:hypothetical protein